MFLFQGFWKAAREAWRWSALVYSENPQHFRLYKRHIRWTFSTVIRKAEALEWFALLRQSTMERFVRAHPRLVFRPFTRYMSLRWVWAKRVKVIRDTYKFMQNQGGFLGEAMGIQGGLILAALKLERGQKALIRVGSDPQFRKEGEIAVILELEGIPGNVTGFAFSLEQESGGSWVGYLGALQGRKGGDQEVIKVATRSFQGLRPKSLMIYLAQEIAHSLGLAHLRGIGNEIQIYRGRMDSPLVPTRNIHFDYDELWKEVGGMPREDGWFEIPLHTPRRTFQEVKSNKRSQYFKRYALMDDLSKQIRVQLDAVPLHAKFELQTTPFLHLETAISV